MLTSDCLANGPDSSRLVPRTGTFIIVACAGLLAALLGPIPSTTAAVLDTTTAIRSLGTGTSTGQVVLRLRLPDAAHARYTSGVPVIVWVPGGYDAGDMEYTLPTAFDDMIYVTLLFPGTASRSTGMRSDGTYDVRGANCSRALADAIRFAAGQIADVSGRHIGDWSPAPVLTNNIGLFGASFGGNLVVGAPARHGREFNGALRYIIQWESPVSSQIATRDFGGVFYDPNDPAKGMGLFTNPLYSPSLYDPLSIPLDYATLRYDPATSLYPVFHDGSGDGQYTTLPVPGSAAGARTPDLNLNGRIDANEDFPFPWLPSEDQLRRVYSRSVTLAMTNNPAWAASWPTNVAGPAEAVAFWDLREAVRLYAAAVSNVPGLSAMVLANVRDHAQLLTDKPHIHQAFDGWNGRGIWVQLNPDPEYVRAVDPTLSAASLPRNAPNVPPADWTVPASYCMPTDVVKATYQAAAIWQMADRVQGQSPRARAGAPGDFDGDRRSDPAFYEARTGWTAWLSGQDYARSGPLAWLVTGAVPLAGDWDGDGLADPTLVAGALWYAWLSADAYRLAGPIRFSGSETGLPVCGDFDGDGRADPAVASHGVWTAWLSASGYRASAPWNGAIEADTYGAADFDGDGRADPAAVAGTRWYAWLSASGYQRAGPLDTAVSGAVPVVGDYDGDGLADPAMVVVSSGDWFAWLSSAGYRRAGPSRFSMISGGMPVP